MEENPIPEITPQPLETSAGARTPVAAAGIAAVVLLSLTGAALFEQSRTPDGHPAVQTAASAAAQDAFADISLKAKSAIVVDMKGSATLYAQNPDVQLPLASLTKIPLALVVREALPEDAVITIPRDTAPPGSAERLVKGEKWRVQDIIDFTLIASSNGGAEILAEAADEAVLSHYRDAPQGKAVLWRMNDLARELGLTHTYFLNVSGLDESTTLAGSYGSARDIATLFAYAASAHPSVFNGTTEGGVLLTSANGRGKTAAYNTNEALGDIPGIVMGKTGFTDLAGGNLAVVFEVSPAHPFVAVVLGSTREGRFDDMRELLERTRQVVAQAP